MGGLSQDLLSAVDDRIVVVDSVRDWIEAIRLAGLLLVRDGIVEEKYIEAMVKVTQELGPYAVLAPGVAMPHARPEDGARKIGISIVIVKNGVSFNSPNDPVYIVIGFAAIDKTSHLNILKELADFLSISDIIKKLGNASSPSQVKEIIKEYQRSQMHKH